MVSLLYTCCYFFGLEIRFILFGQGSQFGYIGEALWGMHFSTKGMVCGRGLGWRCGSIGTGCDDLLMQYKVGCFLFCRIIGLRKARGSG